MHSLGLAVSTNAVLAVGCTEYNCLSKHHFGCHSDPSFLQWERDRMRSGIRWWTSNDLRSQRPSNASPPANAIDQGSWRPWRFRRIIILGNILDRLSVNAMHWEDVSSVDPSVPPFPPDPEQPAMRLTYRTRTCCYAVMKSGLTCHKVSEPVESVR